MSFDQELMKEHFNENYLESEKYKSATYKGQINEKVNLKKPGVYEVSVTGLLSIHGVEQNRTISGTVTVIKNQLRVQTKFNVKLVDHDIKIPTIVFQNIAEVIDVTVDLQFSPKKVKVKDETPNYHSRHFFWAALPLRAQDDLMDMLEAEEPTENYRVGPTWKTMKVG